MSGVAIVLSGLDFSSKNLGKVTFLEDADLESISIIGSDNVVGREAVYSAGYMPANTSQRGVTWSIESGSVYASIDANTGVLTIKSGANSSTVIIKATSVVNQSITASKNITLTYRDTVDELTGIAISGNSMVTGDTAQYSITYTPFNTSHTGVTWSVESGSEYASIDANGLLRAKSTGSVTIKAVSTFDNTFTATKDITITVPVKLLFILNQSAASASNNAGVNPYVNACRVSSDVSSFGDVTCKDSSGNNFCTIAGSASINSVLQDKWGYTTLRTSKNFPNAQTVTEDVDGYPSEWFNTVCFYAWQSDSDNRTEYLNGYLLKDVPNGTYTVRFLPIIEEGNGVGCKYQANDKSYIAKSSDISTLDSPKWIELTDVVVNDGYILMGSNLGDATHNKFAYTARYAMIEVLTQ